MSTIVAGRQRGVGGDGRRPADAGRAVHRVLIIRRGAGFPVAPDIEPVEYRLIHRMPDQMRAARDFVGVPGQRDAPVVINVGDQVGLVGPDLRPGRRPRQGDGHVIVAVLVLVQHLSARGSRGGPTSPSRLSWFRVPGRRPLGHGRAHLGQHLRDRGGPAEVVVDLRLLGRPSGPARPAGRCGRSWLRTCRPSRPRGACDEGPGHGLFLRRWPRAWRRSSPAPAALLVP